MSRKKNNNSKKSVSNGYVSKRIPSGMIHIGTADDGTQIYSASPQIMKQYYPDLYELNPNKADYVFTGKNGVYTPLGASNFTYDKFIDSSLLRYNQNTPKQVIKPKKVDNAEQVSTYGTGPAYSAYDPEHPVTESNIEKYIYWDPVNKQARWVQNRKELENRMFQNNLLEGTLLFGVPPLLALGLSNPATVLPTIGGLAGYMGGSTVLNDAWKTYVSPEHNTFDYDFGNAVVQPIRELFGDKNKASITDKNAEIVGSLLNPLGWITAKVGTNGGKAFNSLGAKTYNGIRNLSLELPESQYLSYLKPPTDEPINTRPTSGLMLKSLFEGNGLERQMNKYGDVPVSAIKSYMKTVSNHDKAIMQKALDTFGNRDRISYNEFKTAVQKCIPTFEKKYQNRFVWYGMEDIGYPENSSKETVFPKTITFEDPQNLYPYRYYEYRKWPMNRHFVGNPLSHSRYFTTADNPGILQITESQGDWPQNVLLDQPRSRIVVDSNTGLTNVKRNEDGTYTLLEDLGAIKDYDYTPERVWKLYGSKNVTFPSNIGLLRESEITPEIRSLYETPVNDPVLQNMANNFERRLLYENLKIAAENGQTKVQYPTPETAIKIQQYEPTHVSTEASNRLSEIENNYKADLKALYNEYKGKFPEWYVPRNIRYNGEYPEDIIKKSYQWDKDNRHNSQVFDYFDREDQLESKFFDDISDILDNQEIMTYSEDQQRVINRYKRFPKVVQDLLKGQEVRTVYDDNNNSWFEIDVPKDFFEREWAFKKGGRLIKRKNTYG